jgi:hypothetical protein
MALEVPAAGNHLLQQGHEIGATHLPLTGWRGEHGGEPDAMKAHGNERIQGLDDGEIVWRDGHPCRDLHTLLHRQERCDARDDARERALAALEGA